VGRRYKQVGAPCRCRCRALPPPAREREHPPPEQHQEHDAHDERQRAPRRARDRADTDCAAGRRRQGRVRRRVGLHEEVVDPQRAGPVRRVSERRGGGRGEGGKEGGGKTKEENAYCAVATIVCLPCARAADWNSGWVEATPALLWAGAAKSTGAAPSSANATCVAESFPTRPWTDTYVPADGAASLALSIEH
jgi:hypothetical protein